MLVCKCTLNMCYRSIMELSVASVEVKKTAVTCKLTFNFMSRSFGYRGDRQELVPSFRPACRVPRTQSIERPSDPARLFHFSSSILHTFHINVLSIRGGCFMLHYLYLELFASHVQPFRNHGRSGSATLSPGALLHRHLSHLASYMGSSSASASDSDPL